MITEDYVSFEIAKLLKEKGFNERCTHYYKNEKYLVDLGYTNIHSYTNSDLVEEFAAPTQAMAMKWLREVCGLIISIEFQVICSTWKWRIYIKSSDDKHTDFQHYNKYEEAVEAALKYSLENLI